MIVLSRFHFRFQGLDELQYVVAPYLAVREEAVYGILLAVKNLQGRFESCCREQFDMRRLDVEDRQGSTCLPQLRQSKEKGAKAGRVEFSQLAEIQRYTNLPSIYQPVEFASKIQVFLTECEAPIQIQNLDSFMLSAYDFERHWGSQLAKERRVPPPLDCARGYSRVTRSQDLSVLNFVNWRACSSVPAPRSFS